MYGVLVMVALAAPPGSTPVPTTVDAVGWAAADVALLAAVDRSFMRYLWVTPVGSDLTHKTNSYIVNAAVSQSSVIQRPDGVAGGWLIRWDLRRLAPSPEGLIRLIHLWDGLAVQDPYFHFTGPAVRIKVAPYKASDGRVYDFKVVDGTIPAPHLAPAHIALEALMGLDPHTHHAPVLRADWFNIKAFTTLEGGLYYDFVGFKIGNRRLNEAELFETVGVSTKLSRAKNGAYRVGMFQSDITDKARAVERVQGVIGRAWVTYDIFDEDTRTENHPLYNLLGIVDNARGKEIIFERQNGMHAFALVDGKGVLVDVAPPNLASDHTTPGRQTHNLQPGISCVRCHAVDDGLKPAPNDVAALLSDGFDLFDDLGNLKVGRIENVDTLAAMYAGTKFDDSLRQGRDDYAAAVFRATAGGEVKGMGDAIAAEYAAYRAPVTADVAALELGRKPDKPGNGAAILKAHIADLATGGAIIEGKSVTIEDPAVAALRRTKPIPIRRQDFERIYTDMARRVRAEK